MRRAASGKSEDALVGVRATYGVVLAREASHAAHAPADDAPIGAPTFAPVARALFAAARRSGGACTQLTRVRVGALARRRLACRREQSSHVRSCRTLLYEKANKYSGARPPAPTREPRSD